MRQKTTVLGTQGITLGTIWAHIGHSFGRDAAKNPVDFLSHYGASCSAINFNSLDRLTSNLTNFPVGETFVNPHANTPVRANLMACQLLVRSTKQDRAREWRPAI